MFKFGKALILLLFLALGPYRITIIGMDGGSPDELNVMALATEEMRFWSLAGAKGITLLTAPLAW